MHPCPYCGCASPYVAELAEGGKAVACPSCGTSGPESVDGDEAEAVRGWEILCGKLCTHCRLIYIKRIIDLKKRISSMEAVHHEGNAP